MYIAAVSANPNRVVKLGVVGAGFVGQHAHLGNYATLPGAKVVALAELRPELGRAVAQRFDIPRVYSSHTEMLRDPEVEAVVAITARPMTGPIAFDCLNAGLHLITEKPMAGTAAQAEKLVRVAHERKLVYVVGYMRRHDAGVLLAKELLDQVTKSGELGQLTFVRAHCFGGDAYCGIAGHVTTDEKVPESAASWPLSPDWVPDAEKPEFAWFMNVYCHNVNLLRFLMGSDPTVTHVEFDRRPGRLAVMRFGNIPATLEAG